VQAAALRVLNRLNNGLRTKPGRGGDGRPWDDEITGCLAELAVAKHLGRYWDGMGGTTNDVRGCEVRSTTHRNGRLIIYPEDKPTTPYVLATLNAEWSREVRLVGWITPFEARTHADWHYALKDGFAANFNVPQDALHPISYLLEEGGVG